VAWYRIFARNATGSNVKARLNDYYYPGTGQQVRTRPSVKATQRANTLDVRKREREYL